MIFVVLILGGLVAVVSTDNNPPAEQERVYPATVSGSRGLQPLLPGSNGPGF